jgi:hypothetical protein
MRSLFVNAITVRQDSSSREPDVYVQLGLEYEAGEETEKIVECGQHVLARVVEERGPTHEHAQALQ